LIFDAATRVTKTWWLTFLDHRVGDDFIADIDECTENGKICLNGECINTPGSHQCQCNPGYQLSPDGAFCLGMYNEQRYYIHILICIFPTYIYSKFA